MIRDVVVVSSPVLEAIYIDDCLKYQNRIITVQDLSSIIDPLQITAMRLRYVDLSSTPDSVAEAYVLEHDTFPPSTAELFKLL